jgi:hypothetical protein
MDVGDLNYFQVDCKIKAQQIAMLQSMRQTPDERFFAQLRNAFQPWNIITDPNTRNINNSIAHGNPNKYIDFHLNSLRYCA